MKRLLAVFLFIFASIPLLANAGVPWRHDFDRALQEAQNSSKPIYVDAFADWCGWCHKLDKDVYSNPQFVKFMQGFVPVKINVEDGKDGTLFANQFKIDSLPTLLVVNAQGKLTNRIGGYMDADDLIQDISAIQALVDREQKNPADLQTSYRLANEYLSRDMNSEAEARFRRILESPQSTSAQKESAQFSIALAQFYQKKLDTAEKSLQIYQANYKNGDSEEDALLLLSEISMEKNSNRQAREYLMEFLKKYPNSGNANRARKILALVEHDLTDSAN